MFRNELIEIRKGMSAENPTAISEELEAASRDSTSKLGKLDDRLYILEEQVAAVARTVFLPSADNQNNSTEVSAQAGLSSSRMGKDGSRHSVGRSESECDRGRVDRVDVFPSQYNACNVCKNEINGRVAGQGTSQCLNDVSKNLCFPKFSDPEKQNIVHFLDDLELYFLLRGVPDSFKLVLAWSAVVDGYTVQWINIVYKDMSSYEQFRETIIEFLWGPQAQARLAMCFVSKRV